MELMFYCSQIYARSSLLADEAEWRLCVDMGHFCIQRHKELCNPYDREDDDDALTIPALITLLAKAYDVIWPHKQESYQIILARLSLLSNTKAFILKRLQLSDERHWEYTHTQ